MAQVELYEYEVAEGLLPRVCMRCGTPAVLTKWKTFAWHPQWVGITVIISVALGGPGCWHSRQIVGGCLLLPVIIIAFVTTKRMVVATPLCERRRYYWFVRALYTYGGLGVLALLVILLFVLSRFLEDLHIGLVGVGIGGLFLAWLIIAAVIRFSSMRAADITESSITLKDVSPAFAEAVREERRQRSANEDDEFRDRPGRGVNSQAIYDPDARRGKGLPPETFREPPR
jgi:hypothetical protein